MQMGTGIVCGLALLGTLGVTAFQTAPKGPPDIEPGKTVVVDWKNTGPTSGEVLAVNGDWVKLRFAMSDKNDPSISAGADAWVNFDKLTYYMAPRPKK
jgi:hypothetical protein